MNPSEPQKHRVIIVGGGFGGLSAARALRKAPVSVTLIDRRNYHLFQPLLYQVATGELSPANIASPLRGVLRRQKNCRVLLGEVQHIDVAARRIELADDALEYDSLILATGATHSYFGRDDWEPFAPGLKTVEDATEIRKRILFAFEAAEQETDPARIHEWLTFVIVGAGPTGLELAGALSEIAHHTLKNDFRSFNPEDANVILIEAGPRPLAMYPEALSQKAIAALNRLHVTVRSGCKVTEIQADRVFFDAGDQTEEIPTRTVIWAAGVSASPLGKQIAEQTEVQADRAGRVPVEADLSLKGHPEVFIIGDLASYTHQTGKPLPGLAPVAMQEGRYVAETIANRLRGKPTKPFHFKDRGSMAVIGRYSAVGVVGKRKLSGFIAWLAWLFIHLMEITQFRNRLLVLMQWGWTFLTRDRAARLITGPVPPIKSPTDESPHPEEVEHASHT